MSGVAGVRALHWPRFWVLLWLLMISAVCVGSLLPARDLPRVPLDSFDKVEHVLGYAILSAYAAMLFATRRAQLLAMLALVALGIALEVAQGAWTTTRSADPMDALADLAGICMGALVLRARARHALRSFECWIRARIG